ncbi:putative nucleic acid-binding protein [Neorhizobium huautlense]|uniref:Nucleic acid-binding protein n=1 Tax=Neorhizobium huautlense TaxID=67774 RepID=A0ABT9PUI5_9HYPH|nr:PIN domain nuclease [Neorhizobium huautlense]MDP9838133.1 putative nucleic acid-binding protein [Neorhizobium huautlense]
MIVADSSVWISLFRKDDVEVASKLRSLIPDGVVLLGDIIVMEVLQGARDESQARWIEQNFRDFPVVSMLSPALAIKAAANYRKLRSAGITASKAPDLIIGTYCIEHGYKLLQRDKHFLFMAEYLGLQLA